MTEQFEHGYTRIGNQILEDSARVKLNGTQFRIILVVWRATYGWHKDDHDISEAFLVKATGIGIRQIKRELHTLLELEILKEVKPPTFNSARVISFNKGWLNSEEVTKKTPGGELATSPDDILDTLPGDELDTQKSYKDTIKEIVEYLNMKASKNFKPSTKDTQKHINARLNEGYTVDDFKKVIDIKVSQWVNDKKFNGYLRPSTLFANKFESYLNEGEIEEFDLATPAGRLAKRNAERRKGC